MTCMTITLAAAVALSTVSVRAAVPTKGAAESAPTQVQLHIDVTGLEHADHDESHHARITRSAMTRDLEAAGFEVVSSDTATDGPAIRFALAWIDFEMFVFELKASVTVKDGEERALKTRKCNDCTSDELVAMMGLQLNEAIEILREPEPEPEAVPSDPVDDIEPSIEPSATTEGESEPKQNRFPFVGVGIGVTVLGLGGVIAGGVLLGRDVDNDGEQDGFSSTDRTSYRPPGIATLAGGIAFLVAGAALIVVGQRRKAKRGKNEKTGASSGRRRITWSPGVTGISGNF